ncbi:MAG: DUF1659 domain-containing protein [Romboutsia sp.]|nr:DUF1659 domain-containing protein [Romboutsia sp.]
MYELIQTSATLKIKYSTFIDGENKIYTKSFSNVKEDASAEALGEVADALQGLHKHDKDSNYLVKTFLIEG